MTTTSNKEKLNKVNDYPKEIYEINQSNESSSLSNSYFEKKPSRTLSRDTMFTPFVPEDEVLVKEDEPNELPVLDNVHPTDTSSPDTPIESLRLSSISLSDMSSVSLSEDKQERVEAKNLNPLQMTASALVDGEKPDISSKLVFTRLSFTPASNDITHELLEEDQESVASPTKSIFSIFSSFRSGHSSTHTSPASSRRPSKQTTNNMLRPSTSVVARQNLSRTTSVTFGLQEALLPQMEQLNQATLKNIKRQSMLQSLVSQNKGDDGYDWDFWVGIISDDQQNLCKVNKDLTKHIRFGIPPSIRGMIWQILAKSKDEELATRYMDLVKRPSHFEKHIQKDLACTFHDHLEEKTGQKDLYHVVKAYTMYDQEVGYCQGLGFIVGPILMNMPDRDAFCLFIQLMNKYGLRHHFTPDMDGLQLRLYQFDALVMGHLPHVARHLKQQEISPSMYASQWFTTLFAYKLPLNLLYRIYDVVFTEGLDSIFKFALALLKRDQSTIIGLDAESLLDFLQNRLFKEYKNDDRQFVRDACELDIPKKRLLQLEKEHKQWLQRVVADATLVEELKNSSLELQQQYKTLESNTRVLENEQQDISTQLRQTVSRLHLLKEEGVSLRTLVSILESTMMSLPAKIAKQTREKYQHLCVDHAGLMEKNAMLEDRVQRAEVELITIKLQYAESENEKEEMYKRIYELKKLISV